jgi:tetratricopeptide (TPR) repeat protein
MGYMERFDSSCFRLFLGIWVGSGVLVSVCTGASGDDPLLRVHRQEAVDMMRQNKFAEAVAICDEILKEDPSHFQDHLLLARAFDKLGRRAQAVEEYQATHDLLPIPAANEEERSAAAETQRRLHTLDPTGEELQRAVAEFEKQLDSMARACKESRDDLGLKRIEDVKSALAAAFPARTRVVLDLSAKTNWIDTGINVLAGNKYEVLASGTWGTLPYPQLAADADGVPHNIYNGFQIGALLGTIGGGPPFLLGKKVTFVANRSGLLKLAINDADNGRFDNWGSQHIYIGLARQEEEK